MKNSAVQSAVTQNINMLNKLHMAMIELYKGGFQENTAFL